MDKNNPLCRPEQAFRVWEDACFIKRIAAYVARSEGRDPGYTVEGPILHAQSLRHELVKAAKYLREHPEERENDDEDWSDSGNEDSILKYIFPAKEMMAIGAKTATKALDTFYWVLGSHSTYALSANLQLLLEATSLKRMLWADVEFPHKTFGIALPQPIRDINGVEYDFMMIMRQEVPVDKTPERICAKIGTALHAADSDNAMTKKLLARENFGMLRVSLYSKALADYKPISQYHKQEALRALAQKNWAKCRAVLKKIGAPADASKLFTHCALELPLDSQEPLTTSMKELVLQSYTKACDCGHPHKEWDDAVHIAVSLSLYMLTLTAKERKDLGWDISPKVRYEGMENISAISDGAAVCTIGRSIEISDEAREALRGYKEGTAVGPKLIYCAPYYRRKPGKGNDPDAPRIVYVREYRYITGKHLLEDATVTAEDVPILE